MESKLVPGSFRDPKGHVYIKDRRVFRTITSHGLRDFQAVKETGILNQLVDEGLLAPWREVSNIDLGGAEETAEIILEHDRIEFISYPYEWSFSGLKAAALLHLEVQLKALAKGVTLSDASAYNVQFINSKPVFIDHLSFRPYTEGEFWVGHDQFCRQFLNPLLLRSNFSIQHNEWFRGGLEGISTSALSALLPWHAWLKPHTLIHVKLPALFERLALRKQSKNIESRGKTTKLPRQSFKNMLLSLKSAIERQNLKGEHVTVWSTYTTTTSYDDAEAELKKAFIANFADKTKPNMLWDIGCNTGEYATIALKAGAKNSIGFEFDSGALEAAFARAISEDLPLLPLYLDAANPSPSQGWGQKERDGFAQRRCADGVIALAVIHHLCIGKNIPIQEAISWLMSLAPQGVIEFVPKKDLKVKELLRFREDIFDDYNWQTFKDEILKNAEIIKSEEITDNGRQLVWYSRKP